MISQLPGGLLMAYLNELLHRLKLTAFYLALSIEEKSMFYHYSNTLEHYLQEETPSYSAGCWDSPPETVSTVRFLWTTAANAIPHRDFSFAEKLLNYALELAQEQEDLAWIHLNLTQLYLDQQGENEQASAKGIFHCQETIKTGYFTGWAQNLLEQFN